MMAAVAMTLMMTAVSGCGNENGESGSTAFSAENEAEEDKAAESGTDESGADLDEAEGTEQDETENDGAPESDGTKSKSDEAGSGDTADTDVNEGDDAYSISGEGVFIGGEVRSVSQDSFVISRTLIEDDGEGMTAMMPQAGSPEEELVTIRLADAVTFERWTISGGGAGIDKAEASFAEVQEGTMLEAQGSFEGEEFVAKKVIIEIYK